MTDDLAGQIRRDMFAADHIRELVKAHATRDKVDRFVPIPNVLTHDEEGTSVPKWTRIHEVHTVVHESLLDQLEESVHQSKDGDFSGGSAKSKPSARLDAIATMQRIDKQSQRLATQFKIDPKPLRERLSAIAGAIGANPHETVRSWWISARCVTGWEKPPYSPDVPCPNMDCERRSSLRIRITEGIGTCTECGEVWGENNFTQLGDYIKWASEHLRGSRHWKYDTEGYPVECVDCLIERQAMAERVIARRQKTPAA